MASKKSVQLKKQQALNLLKNNQLQESMALLSQVCKTSRKDDEAWFYLGAVHGRLGCNQDAAECFRRAITLQPGNAMSHFNLGTALQGQGKLSEAIACHRRALTLQPDFLPACNSLGSALRMQGQLEEAEDCFKKVLRQEPDSQEVLNQLGAIYAARENHMEALICFQKALRIQPGYVDALNNYGVVLRATGKYKEAAAAFKEALTRKPDYAEAYSNLGMVLEDQHQHIEAEQYFRKALTINPRYKDAHNNLGLALLFQWRLGEAIASFQQAISIDSGLAEAYANLGLAQQVSGGIDVAIDSFRKALDLKPGYYKAHVNILFCMNYSEKYEPSFVFHEHRQWESKYGHKPIANPCPDNQDSERCLRIGYVSPDLHSHPVAFFFEPLLANHDPEKFETYCYAEVRRPDAVTERLRSLAGHWRSTRGLSDREVADQIHNDRIDILVDLAGHTGDSRLLVFTHKPAPVQVTYLGYPNTTGLSSVDYRLTDGWADPPGLTDEYHSEELVRLPHGFLCYQPPPDAPAVTPVPSLTNGYITFGSFNNLSKVTPEVISLWSRLLNALPDSRLVLKNNSLSDVNSRDHYFSLFKKHGIDQDRVQLLGRLPTLNEHLALYNNIDIALDTFPYNGTTTTCEVLWMGVPVIALAGQVHAGRVGVSLLSQLDLDDLIGNDQESYLKIAIDLARDTDRLSLFRGSLRGKMENSTLCNGKNFSRDVENAFRAMWRTWCENRQSPCSGES